MRTHNIMFLMHFFLLCGYQNLEFYLLSSRYKRHIQINISLFLHEKVTMLVLLKAILFYKNETSNKVPKTYVIVQKLEKYQQFLAESILSRTVFKVVL